MGFISANLGPMEGHRAEGAPDVGQIKGKNPMDQEGVISPKPSLFNRFKAVLSHTDGKSGGLFILSAQPNLEKASSWGRLGHAVLGFLKAALINATFAPYLAAQGFLLTVVGPFAAFALMIGAEDLAMGLSAITFSPSIAMGGLLKSIYHDFKLAGTGRA